MERVSGHPKATRRTTRSAAFLALSGEFRLQILDRLAMGPATSQELAEYIGYPWLATWVTGCLTQLELIETVQEGPHRGLIEGATWRLGRRRVFDIAWQAIRWLLHLRPRRIIEDDKET